MALTRDCLCQYYIVCLDHLAAPRMSRFIETKRMTVTNSGTVGSDTRGLSALRLCSRGATLQGRGIALAQTDFVVSIFMRLDRMCNGISFPPGSSAKDAVPLSFREGAD